MADNDNNDPNKSNKPINGQMPKRLNEAFTKREQAIHDRYETAKALPLIDKYYDIQQELEATQKGSPEYRVLVEKEAYLQEDFEKYDKYFSSIHNQQLASEISTYSRYRNINERTTTMAGQSKYYRQAGQSKDLYMPTEMLEARIQSRQEQISQLGSEMSGMALGLGVGGINDPLKNRAILMEEMQQQVALDKRILKVQNRRGLSTEKLFGETEEIMGRTERYFEGKGLQERVARGDVRDIGTETKELSLRQRDVYVAQEQYDKAMEDGADNVSDFVKALKSATEALDKQQKLVSEMNRQGVTGPGGGGMSWGDIGMVAALGGRAVATVARGQRTMWVDQQREEMSNKAAFAARANRIYDQAESAIMGGDMDAMLELTSGALDFAKREAMFAKNFTNVSEGIAQVGDAAVGVGNTTQAVINGGKAGLGLASATTATIAGVAQGAIETSNAAVRAGRLIRGGYGAEQALPTYDVALNLQKQMRAMDSRMFQAVYDQGMTTYNSVAGLGNAAGIQAQFMNTGILGNMANAGMTPQQAAQLTAGLRAAGAISATDAVSVIEGAGKAKQKGILGQEEYVSMAAQLMGAGGGAGDLESIMAAAVAAGMDNSKSIGELVSGTMMLSQSMTGMGVGGTGSTQSMLAAASQNLVAAGVDPNLAANAAAMSMANYQAAQGDQSFNLGNIMERSGLRRMGASFRNANTFQLNRLGEMTASEHKVLLDAAQNPKNSEAQDRANQLLKGKGLTEVLNPEGKGIKLEDVREIQKLSFMATAVNKGALGVRGMDIGKIYDKAINKEQLTDKEMAFFQEYGGARGEAILAGIRGDDPATKSPNTKATLQGAEADITRGKFKVKELTDAEAKGEGKVTDIFTALEKTLAGIQENISPEKMSEEVKNAAKNFEAPALTFKEGSAEFKKAVDKFVQHQDAMMAYIGENKSKPSTNTLQQNKTGKNTTRTNPKTGLPAGF